MSSGLVGPSSSSPPEMVMQRHPSQRTLTQAPSTSTVLGGSAHREPSTSTLLGGAPVLPSGQLNYHADTALSRRPETWQLGSICESVSALLVRALESMESQPITTLPPGAQMEVVKVESVNVSFSILRKFPLPQNVSILLCLLSATKASVLECHNPSSTNNRECACTLSNLRCLLLTDTEWIKSNPVPKG